MTSMAVLNAKHVPRLLQLLLLSQWQLLPPLQWLLQLLLLSQ